MGGPGGASQSFHSYLFDCPSPSQDYYLTSSCVNCHNPPTHSKSNPILIQEDTKGICLPKPSPCPAEIRWPEHLQSPIKEIKKYPWWIYQNYLSTQMQEKQLALTPKAIESSIVMYLNPGQEISFDGYKVKTQQGSLVFFNPEFAGQGQNFNLILEGKKLIESQSVSGHSDNAFDALLPKSYIQTIEMKDGHPLLNLAVGPLNLLRSKNNPSYIEYDLMDKITPLLPVAFHLITHETLKLDEYEKLSSNEKKNYQRFTVLYSIAVNKKFPEKIRAEDLFQLYQEFQKPESSSSEKKVAQKNPLLDHLVQSLFINIKVLPDKWINENLYIKFNYQKESEGLNFAIRTQGISEINSLESKTKIDLEELFIPHVIDLKNVSGNLEIKIDEQGKTRLSLNNFYSQIGSIDFLKSNLRKIGLVELKEGSIQDGPSISTEKVHYEPGIHIASLEKNTFQFQTNLVIHAKVALPFFSEVEISTQCVGSFQFRKIEIQSENGEKKNSFELIPQTTHFSFLNLETKKSPLQKWFKGELQLSDVNVSSLNNEESNSFEIQLKMNEFSQTNPLSSGLAKISIPIPLNHKETTHYNWSQFFNTPHLKSKLELNRINNTQLAGDLDLVTKNENHETKYHVDLSFRQLGEDKKIMQHWLDGAQFDYIHSIQQSTTHQSIQLNAKSFLIDPEWTDPLFGFSQRIKVNQPSFFLSLSESQNEKSKKLLSIDAFSIQGNIQPSNIPSSGLLQGPFWLKTIPYNKKPFSIVLDEEHHHAEIKNLRIGFDFKKITLPGMKNKNPNFSSFDVDGKLEGFWSMDTESLEGKGLLTVRGDKEGDLHFRDKKGNRIEGKLNPDDPNRLYEIPLLADTIWSVDRINGVDTKKERINGHFRLNTLIDYMALQSLGIFVNAHSQIIFDFDHMPYSPNGFRYKIQDFFNQIAYQQKVNTEATP